MASGASSCKVVLANSIAKTLLVEVAASIKASNQTPRLHGFLANKDPAARMYADWTKKTCEEKSVATSSVQSFSCPRLILRKAASTSPSEK